MLVDQYNRSGIADKSIGKLADMNDAILMHPEIDNGSKGYHFADYPREDKAEK